MGPIRSQILIQPAVFGGVFNVAEGDRKKRSICNGPKNDDS